MDRALHELLSRVGSGQGHGGERVELAPGSVLITQDSQDDTVYLLVEGRLRINRRVGDLVVELGTITQPGSVVGEMAGLGGGTRSATVVAEERSELVSFSAREFRDLATSEELVERLAALAVRRAEETELAELLASHFSITDPEVLDLAMGSVEWLYVTEGEAVFRQGEPSDSMFFLVRGRLVAARDDRDGPLGEAGRGEVVGETGLLLGAPRTATMVALRDTVLARLDKDAFDRLVDRHPRFMVHLAATVAGRREVGVDRSSPTPILAIGFSPSVDSGPVLDAFTAELSRWGSVASISPGDVDARLGASGLAEARPGEVGELPVARLLHELEIENRHLLVDLDSVPGNWARRCLQMADRVVLVVRRHDPHLGRLRQMVAECPAGLHRSVLILHPPHSSRPIGSAAVADELGADDVLHATEGSSLDLARAGRVLAGRGNAIVLGGGGARGLAHLGVARAVHELGMAVDVVGGTSIGGILATVIADGMPPDELNDWAETHFDRPFDYTIPVVSLVKGARIARSAEITFGERLIEDLWRTYYAVSTNLTTGRPFVHRRGSIGLASRATSAIPGVMPPVPHGEDLLVDGGVLNNLPLDVARSLVPAGRVIAVDLGPPRGGRAAMDYGLSVSGWQALRARSRPGRRAYPALSAVLMRSMFTASMRERDVQIRAGLADLHLQLDMAGVPFLDFSHPTEIAKRGYELAMPQLEEWLRESAPKDLPE